MIYDEDLFRRRSRKSAARYLCALKAPAPIFAIYGRVGLNKKDSVLEVGGGGGGHVRVLRAIGLNETLAIDPFLSHFQIEILTERVPVRFSRFAH